jgi:hypothetical protein
MAMGVYVGVVVPVAGRVGCNHPKMLYYNIT